MQDEQASQRRPATGQTRVDEALARLDELAGLPVTEHPAVFEQVHRRLREVLGELDAGPSGGPGGPGGSGLPSGSGSPGPGR
jgi:hypothetical protein